MQFNTQYLPYEPPTWFQGWLFHEWQAKNESSSPASVFANDNFLGPPDSPIPPPPPAPPPMFTGGMASEHSRHLRELWFAGRTDIQPLPTGHVEIHALGRVPNHTYPLEVETPFTNQVAEQYWFVRNDYSGEYSIDEPLLALHLEDWEHYFPRIHTSLIISPHVDWGLVVPIETVLPLNSMRNLNGPH